MGKAGKKSQNLSDNHISDSNNIKSYTLTKLKRKNYRFFKELGKYIESSVLTYEKKSLIEKLMKDINGCSNVAIYQKSAETKKTTLIGSLSCKNRFCFNCNQQQKRNVKYKYRDWLKLNPQIVEICRNNSAGKELIKYTTETAQAKNKDPEWKVKGRHEYDLMNLILNISINAITETNDEKETINKTKELFKRLRERSEIWKYFVFGGEFGIEIKKDLDKYQIYLHSLLLVRRVTMNKNKLHKSVLEYFSKVKANQSLNCKVSGLKNLYPSQNTSDKNQMIDWDSKDVLNILTESVNYHFEPCSFESIHPINGILFQ